MVINILLSFFWAFFVAMFAIPSIVSVAHFKQLLDEPGHRTVHMSLTPRLGGIAIFAGFTSAFTMFGTFDTEIQQILAGCLVLFFIGLKDDIISVSTFKKFFVQVLATGIVIFIGDIRVTSFNGLLGLYELPIGISYAFTFLMIVGVTNAINLIDGLDGLAGSITLFICLVFGIYFFNQGTSSASYMAVLAFSLAGALVGFLRYNLYKAIVFMGDTGSLVCGFITAILAVKFIEYKIEPTGPAIAVSILILPITDTLRVFIVRMSKGKSPFSPDKNHIHHLLKEKGLNSIQIVSILLFVNLLFFGLSQLLAGFSVNVSLFVIVLLSIILSFWLEFTRKKVKNA
jgi:UDP-GlcNAc:undecaprenyl-phosphate/decaprenyl-phosphate GlcNAc-1-phosphate transferase